jgi:hypothetical protein
MLREIRCEMFRTGEVQFSAGLNVVLGDENATNSIGKSTMLMVVDFVFGGKTLLTHNADVIAELGHHAYEFAFEFEGERHHFRRDTRTPEDVLVCNAGYEVESTMSIDAFTAFLKRAYELPTEDQSFRAAVGLHLRVWGKDNLLVDRPLHGSPSQPARDCIDNLIKTFDLYDGIRDKEAASRKSEAALKALRNASAHELVPHITKRDYLAAQAQIVALERDLDDVRRNLASYATSLGDLINKEVLALKLRKHELSERRLNLAGRLQRVERNLGGKRAIRGQNFEDLQRFFPQVNVHRLEEIEAFHNGVGKILKIQLEQSKEQLTQELAAIDAEIVSIDAHMAAKLGTIEKPETLVDHVYEVALSLRDARASKAGYEMLTDLREAVKNDRAALADEKSRILNVVQTAVNNGMREIVSALAGEQRKSPRLSLDMASYSFEVYEDTGTGTAYFGLALFDLAVFRATRLPVVAHDSILFKNIENDSVSKLIDVYVQSDKQSFIALDEIKKYGAAAAEALRAHCVLQLSDDAVLYVKDWRRRPTVVPHQG